MKNRYQLLGYCGIFCGIDCEVYEAAHSGDIGVKRRAAKALERELGIKIALLAYDVKVAKSRRKYVVRMPPLSYPLMRKKQGIKLCAECQDHLCRIMELWLSKSQSAPKNFQK
jgi:hypothetical protein